MNTSAEMLAMLAQFEPPRQHGKLYGRMSSVLLTLNLPNSSHTTSLIYNFSLSCGVEAWQALGKDKRKQVRQQTYTHKQTQLNTQQQTSMQIFSSNPMCSLCSNGSSSTSSSASSFVVFLLFFVLLFLILFLSLPSFLYHVS